MKIIQKQLKSEPKMLRATWTLDMAKDIEAYHGIDLEDEIARILQDGINAEIVNEAIRKDCMLKGWIEAPFKVDHVKEEIVKLVDWLKANTTEQYQLFGNEIWFMSKKDLTAFVLRWS
jgi:hypothetical protein